MIRQPGRNMGQQDCRFEADPQTERTFMMPWQIFASYLQRPLAKTTSSCSNITSSTTKPQRKKVERHGRRDSCARAHQFQMESQQSR